MKRARFTAFTILFLLFLSASFSLQAQTWSFTGSMETARGNTPATLLNNGLVLIAGGRQRGNAQLTSAELYTPTTGAFTPTGNLNVGRNSHAAVPLPNGQVLIAGGTNNNLACLTSAELYNPSTGQFAVTGSLNTARCGPSGTLLTTGKVLIVDGATAELYDPTTDTFSLTGSLNDPRSSHTATLLANGKVLIAGGCCITNSSGTSYVAQGELYDPTTETFSLTGSLHTARAFHTATLLGNGDVLIAGGQGPNTTSPTIASAELYNPATGTFTTTGSMNAARSFHEAVLLPSGKALVTTGVGFNHSTIPSAELYDASTGTFSLTGSLNDARQNQSQALVLLQNGTALITGGDAYTNGRVFYWNTAELFH